MNSTNHNFTIENQGSAVGNPGPGANLALQCLCLLAVKRQLFQNTFAASGRETRNALDGEGWQADRAGRWTIYSEA